MGKEFQKMNIQKRIDEAAEKFERHWHKEHKSMTVSDYCNDWVPSHCFDQGAHFGFALAVEMLRSKEANKQSDAWVHDILRFNNMPATNNNWADWLEKMREQK